MEAATVDDDAEDRRAVRATRLPSRRRHVWERHGDHGAIGRCVSAGRAVQFPNLNACSVDVALCWFFSFPLLNFPPPFTRASRATGSGTARNVHGVFSPPKACIWMSCRTTGGCVCWACGVQYGKAMIGPHVGRGSTIHDACRANSSDGLWGLCFCYCDRQKPTEAGSVQR